MADIFTPEKRSEIMSRIRSAQTKPEERLFAMVVAVIGRRRKILRNVNSLPGRPDIVIPSASLTIFADGCFYHVCPKHGHQPKSNKGYWTPKLQRNVKQARIHRRRLREMGYSVWSFWEHDLKGDATLDSTLGRLKRRFEKRGLA